MLKTSHTHIYLRIWLVEVLTKGILKYNLLAKMLTKESLCKSVRWRIYKGIIKYICLWESLQMDH